MTKHNGTSIGYKPKYVIGVDPSGNFHEGKGTTGFAVYDIYKDEICDVGYISAKYYKRQVEYWNAVLHEIEKLMYKYNTKIVSVEDYLLYGSKAKSQINSKLETPQLIGAVKVMFQSCDLYFRSAYTARTRWTDKILIDKGYLQYSKSIGYYIIRDGKAIQVIEHSRDAVRHAIHCGKFELKRN